MAHRISSDQEYVWRAVVTRIYPSGKTFSTFCGLFKQKNHASNSATQEAAWGEHPVTITVQRSRLIWEDVETRKDPHDRVPAPDPAPAREA